MELKSPVLLGNYEGPSKRQTDRCAHREVSLPRTPVVRQCKVLFYTSNKTYAECKKSNWFVHEILFYHNECY